MKQEQQQKKKEKKSDTNSDFLFRGLTYKTVKWGRALDQKNH